MQQRLHTQPPQEQYRPTVPAAWSSSYDICYFLKLILWIFGQNQITIYYYSRAISTVQMFKIK